MQKLFFLTILVLSYFTLCSQVAVSKEPRHHVVYEDARARLLNVLLPAGDTTLYHLHSTPSVFICFSKTKTGSQLMGQPPSEAGYSTAGNIWYENLNPPHTKTHRVWNVDTTAFHVMDVELLMKDSGFTDKPFTLPNAKLVIDEPWVRTYSVTLQNNEELTIPAGNYAFLFVAIADCSIAFKQNKPEAKALKEGNFFWIKQREGYTISNTDSGKTTFALLQIR